MRSRQDIAIVTKQMPNAFTFKMICPPAEAISNFFLQNRPNLFSVSEPGATAVIAGLSITIFGKIKVSSNLSFRRVAFISRWCRAKIPPIAVIIRKGVVYHIRLTGGVKGVIFAVSLPMLASSLGSSAAA